MVSAKNGRFALILYQTTLTNKTQLNLPKNFMTKFFILLLLLLCRFSSYSQQTADDYLKILGYR